MILSHPIPSAVFDSVDQSIDQSFNQSLNQQNNQLTSQSIRHHGFLQNLCSTPLLQRSLSRQPRPPSSRNQGKQKKKKKKEYQHTSIPPKPQQKKKTPQLTSFSSFFFSHKTTVRLRRRVQNSLQNPQHPGARRKCHSQRENSRRSP